MAVEPTDLDTIILDYASQTIAAEGAPLEHVAACVRRVAGFANAGEGASGHRVAIDEPEEFGGTGGAADPAELLLIAVGSSLSVTLTVHAALANIVLDDVRIALKGNLDAKRFFEPSDALGGGFFDLTIDVELTTRASPLAARALLDAAMLASPMVRSVAATPITRLVVNGTAI